MLEELCDQVTEVELIDEIIRSICTRITYFRYQLESLISK